VPQKRYEIGPSLPWKSQVTYQSASVLITLSDLERQDAKGPIFQADFVPCYIEGQGLLQPHRLRLLNGHICHPQEYS